MPHGPPPRDRSDGECSGPIREIRDSTIVRFRCQVGHAHSAQAMFAGRLERLESELWHLVSSSEEARRLARLLADQARKENLPEMARDFDIVARSCESQSQAIQRLVQQMPSACTFAGEILANPTYPS